MTRFIRLPSSLVLGVLAILAACHDPSGLSDQVDFEAAPLAQQADPRLVAFRFTLTNSSADTVWIAGCDQRITPDVAFIVNGRTVDTSLGGACLAIYDMRPVALAPGQSYTGERAVPHQTGVRYVASLAVARDRNLQSGARVQAAAFDAP